MHRSRTSDAAPQTVIVVPCYNEEDRLPVDRFRQFAHQNPGFKFLMVNDGSSDGTAQLLGSLEKEHPKSFEFLDLPVNGGKAEAVREGVLHAIWSHAKVIGFWDADLSTALEPTIEFESILHRHPNIDLVIGSRLSLLGRSILRNPIRKRLGRVFAAVASLALGIRVRDTQCGAKFFRTTPDMIAAFSNPFLAKWIFDVELIARMRQLRKQSGRLKSADFIFEAPLDRWEEVGSSRLKSNDFLTAIFDLVKIYWRHVRPGARTYKVHPSFTNLLDRPGDSTESTRRAA